MYHSQSALQQGVNNDESSHQRKINNDESSHKKSVSTNVLKICAEDSEHETDKTKKALPYGRGLISVPYQGMAYFNQ